MTYNFIITTPVTLPLAGLDLATEGTLSGLFSFQPTGELNDEQLATAISSVNTALTNQLGTSVTVELQSINS